jgi:hypothetical protein
LGGHNFPFSGAIDENEKSLHEKIVQAEFGGDVVGSGEN